MDFHSLYTSFVIVAYAGIGFRIKRYFNRDLLQTGRNLEFVRIHVSSEKLRKENNLQPEIFTYDQRKWLTECFPRYSQSGYKG